jgi:hypothetical protein
MQSLVLDKNSYLGVLCVSAVQTLLMVVGQNGMCGINLGYFAAEALSTRSSEDL